MNLHKSDLWADVQNQPYLRPGIEELDRIFPEHDWLTSEIRTGLYITASDENSHSYEQGIQVPFWMFDRLEWALKKSRSFRTLDVDKWFVIKSSQISIRGAVLYFSESF